MSGVAFSDRENEGKKEFLGRQDNSFSFLDNIADVCGLDNTAAMSCSVSSHAPSGVFLVRVFIFEKSIKGFTETTFFSTV